MKKDSMKFKKFVKYASVILVIMFFVPIKSEAFLIIFQSSKEMRIDEMEIMESDKDYWFSQGWKESEDYTKDDHD